MSGLAGRLRERIIVTRSSDERDAIGGEAGTSETIGTVWAELVPRGGQALSEGDARVALPLWAVTLRRCDLRVGDGIAWGTVRLIVRSVVADPRTPDRIEAIAEEQR